MKREYLTTEAEKLFLALDEHQQRRARYAYQVGKVLIHIKRTIGRGEWGQWKENVSFAKPRKIEMYMRIAEFLGSEQEAADFGSIVVADKIAAARKQARRQGRRLDQREERNLAARASKRDI